jgi:membrane carboxypeptidase/penicillin-binding protein PbpC
MKIYDIVIKGDGTFMSSVQNHYIMAENFADAYEQGLKRLAQVDEAWRDEAYIESISEQFELEVIK